MKSWMRKSSVLFLFGFIALFLSGCGKENLSALIPKGYGAKLSFDLIVWTTIIMTLVFIVVAVVYVIVLFRFREKKGDKEFIPKQTEGHKTLETVWTIIPVILVVIIAIPTFIAIFDLADTTGAKDAINIDVKGNQFWWQFDYEGEEISTSQDLYIPTGEKVFIHLQSNDVIHSFWVPALSGKLDVNPENVNTMYLKTDEEGVYYGKCAELCGFGHSLMDFKVIAVSPDKYEQWVKDMQAVDPDEVPEGSIAQEGKELFAENNCMGCHAIGNQPESIGPNLGNYGNRTTVAGFLDHTKENLIKWIDDPDSVKPGNKMAGNYPELTDDELDKIATYLMQLKATEITPESVK